MARTSDGHRRGGKDRHGVEVDAQDFGAEACLDIAA
jgi:hypothetical protein